MGINCEGLKFKVSQQEQIESLKINERRQKAVDFLFNNLKYGGEWLKIEGIKLLFFYRDMPSVNERLNEYFADSDNKSIKKTVAEFLAGTLNVDDVIEKRKRYEEVQEDLRLLKLKIANGDESENSELTSKGVGTFGFLGLSSLKISDLS